MNHKRKRPKNRRAGCLHCKYWKVNGHRTERPDGERFSDHRRRYFADREIRDVGSMEDAEAVLAMRLDELEYQDEGAWLDFESKRLLVILDEASDLPMSLWDTIENLVTADGKWIR